jgi:hypothetical protein
MVIGRERMRRPVAWKTALAMAAAMPTRPIWPTPLTPAGNSPSGPVTHSPLTSPADRAGAWCPG